MDVLLYPDFSIFSYKLSSALKRNRAFIYEKFSLTST